MLGLESTGNKRKKNDLKTAFTIIVSHQINGRGIKKKGSPTYPKRSSLRAFLPLQQRKQIQNRNYDRLHDLLECHKSFLFFFLFLFFFFCVPFFFSFSFFVCFHDACLVGRGFEPTFTPPCGEIRRDLHCDRLSSNICRMIMYRLPCKGNIVF